jgi:hypothetical protein
MMQNRENIESWRRFILDRINEMLKIFQSDIENYLNRAFAQSVYSSTNATREPNTPCNLTRPEDIAK